MEGCCYFCSCSFKPILALDSASTDALCPACKKKAKEWHFRASVSPNLQSGDLSSLLSWLSCPLLVKHGSTVSCPEARTAAKPLSVQREHHFNAGGHVPLLASAIGSAFSFFKQQHVWNSCKRRSIAGCCCVFLQPFYFPNISTFFPPHIVFLWFILPLHSHITLSAHFTCLHWSSNSEGLCWHSIINSVVVS